MRDLPTGTITLLFTDIEGSTHLLQQLGAHYAELLTECRDLLRAAFHTYHGHEVDAQGDAIFTAFARASDALSAAVAAQRKLALHSWPDAAVVRVRMGLHTGEPSRVAEGYVGLDVHYAARIMSAGHGGQVLLSRTTRDLVEQDLPAGVSLRDLGEYHLKDVERPIALYQAVIAGLPADFPPLKTLDRRSGTLPVQPTPLIGRKSEVATIGQLLRREDVRLVTLTGPGGTGKTRLGLQVASELRDVFVDGVFLYRSLPSTILCWSCLPSPRHLVFGMAWDSLFQPALLRCYNSSRCYCCWTISSRWLGQLRRWQICSRPAHSSRCS